MWTIILYTLLFALILYIATASFYLLFLALAYFLVKESNVGGASARLNRFAVVVPAHNEELLVGRLCRSLLEIDYPQNRYEVFLIADNCEDRTVAICSEYPVRVLQRKDPARLGKGFALQWAMENIPLNEFDAVFMVDADNVVDAGVLNALNAKINQGYRAIQCQNAVGNRRDSWFTQLLFVSRTVGNHLYHHAKHKLGLSSYLMGNGLCFTTELLREKGWTAFTVGEDWEYYAQLAADRIKIGFCIDAKVFHQESRSLNQATSQRLRWASGKFYVFRKYGLNLLWKGIRERDLYVLDASLPLVLPNYSLLVNITILVICTCFFLPASPFRSLIYAAGWLSLLGQLALFGLGACLAGEYWQVFKAVMYAPVFLAWKSIIDLLSASGLYKAKKWVRTKRHRPS
jgi:cellulose synthase/poly-beta-1,6-N-acetylglucosamine synthase-like glycosyltransferase